MTAVVESTNGLAAAVSSTPVLEDAPIVNGKSTMTDIIPEASVNQFTKSIEGINRSSFAFDGDRVQALRAAYALVSRLETSWDTVARLVLTEASLTTRHWSH